MVLVMVFIEATEIKLGQSLHDNDRDEPISGSLYFLYSTECCQVCVVVHTFHSTELGRQRQVNLSEFEDSPVYIAGSRSVNPHREAPFQSISVNHRSIQHASSVFQLYSGLSDPATGCCIHYILGRYL